MWQFLQGEDIHSYQYGILKIHRIMYAVKIFVISLAGLKKISNALCIFYQNVMYDNSCTKVYHTIFLLHIGSYCFIRSLLRGEVWILQNLLECSQDNI